MYIILGILAFALGATGIWAGLDKGRRQANSKHNVILANFIDVLREMPRIHAQVNGKQAQRQPDVGDMKMIEGKVHGSSHGIEYEFDAAKATILLKLSAKYIDQQAARCELDIRSAIEIDLGEPTSSLDMRRIEWLFESQKKGRWIYNGELGFRMKSFYREEKNMPQQRVAA